MKMYGLFLLVLPLFVFPHRVELFDGTVINTDKIVLKGNKVILSDTTLPRDNVKSISFKSGTVLLESKNLPEDVKKLLNLRNKLIKKYGDYAGVIILDKGHNRLFADGTRSYRYHFQGLILKDNKRSWGTFSRYFNEDMEKMNIEMARVIKPDGRIINLDRSKIKISKPKREMVYFGKGKAVSFSLPDVEVGDIVEYVYTDNIFNPWNKKIYGTSWFFGGEDPVLTSIDYITLPVGKHLNFKLMNAKNALVESTNTDSGNTYIFKMENVMPPIKEPQMPPMGDILPSLHTSTFKKWDYIFDWYARFQTERMKITPEIQSLVDSLTEGLKTEEEKTAVLYHWVQRNIRYISIKGAVSSGVSGHPASVTLKNGYGDCTDKSILFSTMLHAAGVEAYPVYVQTNDGPTLVKSIPSFYGDHCITEIFPKKGGHYFLDPVSTYDRYPSFASMDHGVWAICAMKKRIDFIDVPPPTLNQRNYSYIIDIDRKGTAKIAFHSQYTGDIEAAIRAYWERLKPEEKKLQFSQMVKETSPNAILVDYSLKNLTDISKPLKMKIVYKIDNFLEQAGDMFILRLPEINRRYTMRGLGLANRRYPLVYMTSEGINHTFDIVLPKGMEVSYFPDSITKNMKDLHYSGSYSISGDTLIYKDRFERYGRKIPPEDYKKYRKFMGEISDYVKKPILIKELGGEG